MTPIADSQSSCITADIAAEAIRLAVNVAQSECVCHLHLCVCLLTDGGERAGIQPHLYEQGFAA